MTTHKTGFTTLRTALVALATTALSQSAPELESIIEAVPDIAPDALPPSLQVELETIPDEIESFSDVSDALPDPSPAELEQEIGDLDELGVFDFPDLDSFEAKAQHIASLLTQTMPVLHIRHQQFNARMAPSAWTNFIDSLDYEHIYFTQEDLAEFDSGRTGYATLLAQGKTDFPRAVFERFVERVSERSQFVAQAVNEEFDVNEDETYLWRRHSEPFPANREEQDEIWRKRVKNALLASRISTELANERAAQKLAENPEAEATVKDPEEAYEAAKKDLVDSYSSFVQILHDSDSEYWLPRFFNGMARAYDPHSDYMSPASTEDFSIDMQLSLQGIGATLQTDDGTAKVVAIIPGSPAERDTSSERLVPGDRIIAVAQEGEDFVDVRHWPLYKTVRLIRGPKGSTVRLKVIPASDQNGFKEVSLVRDEIKLEEQAASSKTVTIDDEKGISRTLGYIKLPGFYSSEGSGSQDASFRTASGDMSRLIAELKSSDVEGLILDLRKNGGGSLPEAVQVAGLFLRSGPIVQVRDSVRTIPLPSYLGNPAFSKPMVVLIDRLSASASEIVAAALQDYGRAIIVGDSKSHGKGSVQSVIPLQSEEFGSLKATSAMFYRVTGASTQIRGVASDIHLPSFFEAYPELGEDKLPGALPWTHIGPARGFRPVGSMADVIPELRARSAERIAASEAWSARLKLLDRFSENSTNSVVSLKYDDRRQRAVDDERLRKEVAEASSGESLDQDFDIQDSFDSLESSETSDEDDIDGDRGAKGGDMVLDEAFRILIDLIDIKGSPAGFAGPGLGRALLDSLSP